MRRREIITLIGAAAAGWPLSARAQRTAIPQIGLLDPGVSSLFAAFEQGMRDLGYIEGQTVSYLRASAEGRAERVPQLAAELVARNPDVIVTAATLPVHAVQERTSKIPIVFAALGDAVGLGVVSNLARPGGNLTGLSFLNTEIRGKRLELLRDMLPGLQRVAVLWDAANQPRQTVEPTEAAARQLGIELQLLQVRGPDDFEAAFRVASKQQAQAVNVFASAFFNSNRLRLADLALRYRLPAMYETGEYVRDGGLIAYGPILGDLFRRAATYVDKILRGAKPGDLPVEQPTKFELVINLQTAKAIGLTIPESLLFRADSVVE